ncbi:hypothetical protein EPI10_023075 [Gossypium australe]|uniref:Uncharacterized protein n=1 Tax=Gossypium australe TaxID=47621 RepID=A0A5B6VUF8_9ROSI|nr:hypothetical protein EPI10_023075 [Gossypium australe]
MDNLTVRDLLQVDHKAGDRCLIEGDASECCVVAFASRFIQDWDASNAAHRRVLLETLPPGSTAAVAWIDNKENDKALN